MAHMAEEVKYLADFFVFFMTSLILFSAVPLIEQGKGMMVMIILIVSALLAWRWRVMFHIK